jgi:hypothetical protein
MGAEEAEEFIFMAEILINLDVKSLGTLPKTTGHQDGISQSHEHPAFFALGTFLNTVHR